MPTPATTPRVRDTALLRELLAGIGIVGVATMLSMQLVFDPAYMTDAALIYLLGLVVAALRLRPGPSLLTALLAVLVYDFVFVPPALAFVPADPRHLGTLAVMLSVAVIISRLARRMRGQAEAAAARARRSAALCDMSRDLGAAVER